MPYSFIFPVAPQKPSFSSSSSPPLHVFKLTLRGSHTPERTWIPSNSPLTLSQMSQSCFPLTAELFHLIIFLILPSLSSFTSSSHSDYCRRKNPNYISSTRSLRGHSFVLDVTSGLLCIKIVARITFVHCCDCDEVRTSAQKFLKDKMFHSEKNE